jgi:hypothetical protein
LSASYALEIILIPSDTSKFLYGYFHIKKYYCHLAQGSVIFLAELLLASFALEVILISDMPQMLLFC